MMTQANIRKEPDGWRAYIKDGDRIIVVDGFFEDELEAAAYAAGLK